MTVLPRMRDMVVGLGLVVLAAALTDAALAQAPPEAEGFGGMAAGGENGRVIWVTNLSDSGPGSFREAVTSEGARIVRFKVGGIIELSDTIRVRSGRLTVDGLSAASYGGITLFGRGLAFEGLECRDVIVHNIRVRRSTGGGDCITVKDGAHRVLIDHCSVSWADDENVGVNKGHYVTVQWCIIGEGLIEGKHAEGAHPCGMLVAHGANHVTIHHNYFAGNAIRNPLLFGVGGMGSGGAWPECYPGEKMAVFMPNGLYDIRNNVMYNFTSGTELGEGIYVNIVGNYYRFGPDDFPLVYPPSSGRGMPVHLMLKTYYPGCEQPKVFCKGNIGPRMPEGNTDEWGLVYVGGVGDVGAWGDSRGCRSGTPFMTPPVKTHTAKKALKVVLGQAGAYPRDEVDQRLVEEFRTGTGRMGYGYRAWKEERGLTLDGE